MSRSVVLRLLIVGFLVAALFTGCNRDPNVRKQRFLESGNRYRDQDKIREAAIQYANALQLDPHFAEAHHQLGDAYIKLKNYYGAYTELTRAVDLAPDNYSAQVDLAGLLISGGGLKQAQPHLDLLRGRQPDNPDTHLVWSNFYAAQGNVALALLETQKAISADPGRPDSYLNLAKLQLYANQPDQAEISFKKAAELAPTLISAQLALGAFYQSRNRWPEAEQQLKHAIGVDPKDPAPRAAYVRLLMSENKKAEAEAFL